MERQEQSIKSKPWDGYDILVCSVPNIVTSRDFLISLTFLSIGLALGWIWKVRI